MVCIVLFVAVVIDLLTSFNRLYIGGRKGPLYPSLFPIPLHNDKKLLQKLCRKTQGIIRSKGDICDRIMGKQPTSHTISKLS